MTKNVLVIGATGFVGSVLCKKLIERGYRVWGIGRKKYGFLENDVVGHREFRFIKCDVTQEIPPIDKYFDGVFHLASQQPSQKNLSYEEYYKGNVKTLINLRKFLIHSNFLLFASTTKLYKPTSILTENSELEPSNFYSLTKYISEKWIHLERCSKQNVIIRFPSICGRNHLGGIIYTLYTLAKSSQPIEVFSKGERLRNIIHVDDVAEIMIRAYEKRNSFNDYELFIAGSSDSLKMREIAEIVKRLTNSSSEILLSKKKSSPDWDVVIDISKIVKKLEFTPMTTGEAIEKYIKEMEGLL